jgi:hypothetical protein
MNGIVGIFFSKVDILMEWSDTAYEKIGYPFFMK